MKPLSKTEAKILAAVKPMLAAGRTIPEIAVSIGTNARALHYHIAAFRARKLIPAHKKAQAKGEVKLDALPARIMDFCKNKPRTLGELSMLCDRSKASIEQAVKEMYAAGLDISVRPDTKKVEVELSRDDKRFPPINLDGLKKTTYKFGVVSDTHLGSKCQQLTLLKSAYADFDRENVDFVIHAGDLVDGHKMYKGQEYELFMHSADEQRDYAIAQYPRLKNGKKTYVIAGNHDESFKKSAGYNIVRDICTKRSDLVYEGMIGATFNIGRLRVEAVHPSGGVSYARSYKSQKHAENMLSSLIELVRAKKDLSLLPHIMILGNWHIADILPDYQGMLVVTQPCFQSQTSYLRAKGLTPNIGYTLFELSLDKNGNLQEMWHKYQPLGHLAIKNDF
jgi:predicted phosphodiesterase